MMDRDNLTGTALEIVEQCDCIAEMLIGKNRQYGDSALHPLRLFSGADAVEQINVRIDDKLSRIRSAQADDQEDAELDLIGYLMLKRVAVRRQLANKAAAAPSRRRFYEKVFHAAAAESAEADDGMWRPVDPQEPVGDPEVQVAGVEPRIMEQVHNLGFMVGKRSDPVTP